MKRVLYNFRYKWSLSMLNGDDIDKKQYSTLLLTLHGVIEGTILKKENHMELVC